MTKRQSKAWRPDIKAKGPRRRRVGKDVRAAARFAAGHLLEWALENAPWSAVEWPRGHWTTQELIQMIDQMEQFASELACTFVDREDGPVASAQK